MIIVTEIIAETNQFNKVTILFVYYKRDNNATSFKENQKVF